MIRNHPGHRITVTRGQVRWHVECSCGLDRRFASVTPANRAALAHHHAVGGCNCPAWLVARPYHPPVLRLVPDTEDAPAASSTA